MKMERKPPGSFGTNERIREPNGSVPVSDHPLVGRHRCGGWGRNRGAGRRACRSREIRFDTPNSPGSQGWAKGRCGWRSTGSGKGTAAVSRRRSGGHCRTAMRSRTNTVLYWWRFEMNSRGHGQEVRYRRDWESSTDLLCNGFCVPGRKG